MTQITKGTNTYSYKYDDNGIRTQKTVNGITTYYTTVDGRITGQYDETNTLYFRYDSNNSLFGFNLNGTEYIYLKNIQGDIEGILDLNGDLVVKYTYDAWGKVLSVTGELASTVGMINPMRYRDYYLDVETGYYYLQSRYYNPEFCRFINADEPKILIFKNTNIICYFSYCDNNPITNYDETGFWYYSLWDFYYKNFMKKNIDSKYSYTALLYKSYCAQYEYNVKKLGDFDGYIYNQNNKKFAKLKFASAYIKDVGCETIAIYNVMKRLSKFVYYPDVINECYLNDLDWLSGHFGIWPKHIKKYFDAHDVNYKYYTSSKKFFSKIAEAKVGIISYWNGKPYVSSLHTIAFKKTGTSYYFYNSDQKYNSINKIKKREFICGYLF